MSVRKSLLNGTAIGVSGVLLMLVGFLPSWASEKATPNMIKRPFGELFLYGQISLEPGGGLLYLPGKTTPVAPAKKQILVPTDSVLQTRASETAHLIFGSGSQIWIGPQARIRIRRFSLEVTPGSFSSVTGARIFRSGSPVAKRY